MFSFTDIESALHFMPVDVGMFMEVFYKIKEDMQRQV
jgi:hypothetical protein